MGGKLRKYDVFDYQETGPQPEWKSLFKRSEVPGFKGYGVLKTTTDTMGDLPLLLVTCFPPDKLRKLRRNHFYIKSLIARTKDSFGQADPIAHDQFLDLI